MAHNANKQRYKKKSIYYKNEFITLKAVLSHLLPQVSFRLFRFLLDKSLLLRLFNVTSTLV